jgi:hypothetical protein
MEHKYPQYYAFEHCKKQRDCLAEIENTQYKLKEELLKLGFPVTDPLHLNCNRNIQQEGKTNEWSYIAWYQKDESRNTCLKCSAGFTQIGKQHDISIPIQEIKRKK